MINIFSVPSSEDEYSKNMVINIIYNTVISLPNYLATGDINGDGYPDFIDIRKENAVLYANVYLNNGTNSSIMPIPFIGINTPAIITASNIRVLDINGSAFVGLQPTIQYK